MAFKSPSKSPENGWCRTWPDSEDDGVLWRDGERVGRVYRHHDGRWQWYVQIGDCKNGICASKERAKVEVEQEVRFGLPMSRDR